MDCVNWQNLGQQWVRMNLASVTARIPVFEQTGLVVKVNSGKAPGVLCRNAEFDAALANITDDVVVGYKRGIEGMLYVLYVMDGDQPIPVYVGIAQAAGHTGRLSSLFRSARKKPRFDDYDGYHIGDLSTQVIPGYPKQKAYKKVWADRMFLNAPSMTPRLRTPVYFWGKPWGPSDISAAGHLGHTSLCLEEWILIDAFRAAYHGKLLNR